MNEVKLVFEFMKKNSVIGTMFDVGAMDGCSAQNFLKNKWTVYSFEPNPNMINKIKKIKHKHGFRKWIIEQTAVGEQPKKDQPFYLSSESVGISSLVPFHKTHQLTYKVDIIRLDEYMNEKKIQHVNFLKIDTEGYDYFVLKSYPWIIDQPEFIVCEFEDSKTKEKLEYIWKDMANFLVEKGYNVLVSEWYKIVKYGEQHKWRCFKLYPCELNDNEAWGNLIAIKNKTTFDQFYKNITKI